MENEKTKMTGVEIIAQKRNEQITKHGRSQQYDRDYNVCGELADSAVALLSGDFSYFPKWWDQDLCKKMIAKRYAERLATAGALIAAEIDRINAIESEQ